MDDNVFVLVEDPTAPTRADVLAAAPPGQEAAYLQSPSHYRTTFLTLNPPNALEQLLSQLKARWVPVRQTGGGQKAQTLGLQLSIEGHIFAIGTDWLVRVGNVILAGGAVKGMLLEVKRWTIFGKGFTTEAKSNCRLNTFLCQHCIHPWPMEHRNYFQIY